MASCAPEAASRAPEAVRVRLSRGRCWQVRSAHWRRSLRWWRGRAPRSRRHDRACAQAGPQPGSEPAHGTGRELRSGWGAAPCTSHGLGTGCGIWPMTSASAWLGPGAVLGERAASGKGPDLGERASLRERAASGNGPTFGIRRISGSRLAWVPARMAGWAARAARPGRGGQDRNRARPRAPWHLALLRDMARSSTLGAAPVRAPARRRRQAARYRAQIPGAMVTRRAWHPVAAWPASASRRASARSGTGICVRRRGGGQTG